MMKRLLSEIQTCERAEFGRAAKDHGSTFHSLHEAYAVMLEEVDEASTEMRGLDGMVQVLWQATRQDDVVAAMDAAADIHTKAILLAAEAVQVAAMAHKTINSIEQFQRRHGQEPPRTKRRPARKQSRESP